MQLLVVLEDCVLVKNVKKKEEYLLQLDMQRAGLNDGENLIDIWQEQRKLLAQGKISEDEYDV